MDLTDEEIDELLGLTAPSPEPLAPQAKEQLGAGLSESGLGLDSPVGARTGAPIDEPDLSFLGVRAPYNPEIAPFEAEGFQASGEEPVMEFQPQQVSRRDAAEVSTRRNTAGNRHMGNAQVSSGAGVMAMQQSLGDRQAVDTARGKEALYAGMEQDNLMAAATRESLEDRKAVMDDDAVEAAKAAEIREFRGRKMQDQIIESRMALRDRKIDPKRVFNNMSGLERVVFMITAALNGYNNASLGKAGNETIDLAMKMVDQDMSAQEADLDNAWKSHSDLIGERDFVMEALDDRENARQVAIARKLDAIGVELQAKAAALAPGKNKAAFLAAANALDVQATDLYSKTLDKVQANMEHVDRLKMQDKISQRANATQRGIAADRIKFEREQKEIDRKLKGAEGQDPLEHPKISMTTGFSKTVDGKKVPIFGKGATPDKRYEDVDKALSMSQGAEIARRALYKLRALNLGENSFSAISPTSEYADKVRQYLSQYIQGVTKMNSQGLGSGVSNKDLDVFLSQVGHMDFSKVDALFGAKGTVISDSLSSAEDQLHREMNTWIKRYAGDDESAKWEPGAILDHEDFAADTPDQMRTLLEHRVDLPPTPEDKEMWASDQKSAQKAANSATANLTYAAGLVEQVKKGDFDDKLQDMLRLADKTARYGEALRSNTGGPLAQIGFPIQVEGENMRKAVVDRFNQLKDQATERSGDLARDRAQRYGVTEAVPMDTVNSPGLNTDPYFPSAEDAPPWESQSRAPMAPFDLPYRK